MTDKIAIQKIGNGYICSSDWFKLGAEHTLFFENIPKVLKHLKIVYDYKDEVKLDAS